MLNATPGYGLLPANQIWSLRYCSHSSKLIVYSSQKLERTTIESLKLSKFTYLLIWKRFWAINHCDVPIIIHRIRSIILVLLFLLFLIFNSVYPRDEKTVAIFLDRVHFRMLLFASFVLWAWLFIVIKRDSLILLSLFVLETLEVVNVNLEFLVIGNVGHIQIDSKL